MQIKADLRKIYSKNNIGYLDRESATIRIIENLEILLSNAKGNVGIYFPMNQEIDLLPIMLKKTHLQYSLPKIINNKIIFVHYALGSSLENNLDYPKIKEPQSTKEVIPQMILVPGLAFDLKGNRLGRGRGHYDKYFANNNANITKIGIAFNSNIIENLPSENHDCKMDYIVSEEILLRLS